MEDFSFNLPSELLNDINDSLDEMQHKSNSLLSDLEPMDSMFNNNKSYHIRTGMIQDPNYPATYQRVDSDGNEIEGLYTTTNPLKAKYPLNCKNSVDSYGMRVSVVWLDGNESGIHYDATQSSTIGKPVQKLWLTFPQAWSDRDRSCGDFSLPVNGTICRIGMVRGDVGVFLGSIPLDKENLPHINPGDFLRRHHNQNSQYITDNNTKQAHTDVLDKDLYKKKLQLQALPPDQKNYETDETKLSNVYNYHSNRHVIAQDGISTSTKVCKNKHSSVCNKRVFEWNTNLDLDQAFEDAKASVSGSANNLIELQLSTPEGDWVVSQTEDNKHITTLNTTKNLSESLDLILGKLEVKTAKINAEDGCIDITQNGNKYAVLLTTMSNLSESLDLILGKLEVKTAKINAEDGCIEFIKGTISHSVNLTTILDLYDAIDLVKEKLTPNSVKIVATNGSIDFTCELGFLNSSFNVTSNTLDLNDLLLKLKTKFTFKSGTLTASDGVMQFTCDLVFNYSSFSVTTSKLTLEELATILSTNFITLNTVSVNIITSDAVMNWVLRRGSVYSSITPAEALLASALLIMGRPGKQFSVTGINRVISGSCILPDAPIDIITCTLPDV